TKATQAQAKADRLGTEASRLKTELAQAQSGAAEAKTANDELQAKHIQLQSEFQALQRERDAVTGSITWRATAPLRTVAVRLPAPLRSGLRRTAKLGWWLATPWAIPRRLKSLRERRARSADATLLSELPQSSAELDLIATSELLDREWYLKTNPDVAEAGVDPGAHYFLSGAAEGRDPGPRFPPQSYVRRYPDIAAAGANPLLHYLQHGINEGRDISSGELPQLSAELDLIAA